MSETSSEPSSRPVGGPPPRRAAKPAPASSLIKRNRPQPSFAAAEEVATEAPVTETSPVPSADVESGTALQDARNVEPAIAPVAFLDHPEAATAASTAAPDAGPTVEPPTVAPSVAQAAPVVDPAPPVSVAPRVEEGDPLVNATFRVRRSSKKAFDAAFLAAKLHEGWPSAEAFFQDLLERETRRIEQAYNDGQPFPVREKALPRGRPIGS
ncbi:hypothetical protein ACFVU2_18845 [Leifsonia sp. NPDC058194]|uniref:hypothetical protein n=1 Tax=Leifsonia sp. NPDC058194 TaxID=3346374 RepID=UPI0036D91891